MIDFTCDGHLVINWKVLSGFGKYGDGEGQRNVFKFVYEFFNVLFEKVLEISEEERELSEDFRRYLH